MKVLMLSLDSSILDPRSSSAERMRDYGSICDELHVVVFCSRSQFSKYNANSTRMTQIANNVWVYPTNSLVKPLAIFDAYRISKKIIRNWKLEIRNFAITAQDPFETGLVGLLLSHRFKVGFNIQVHGDFWSNPYWRKESALNYFRDKIGRFIIKRADTIRVVSQKIKKSLIDLDIDKRKIFVIPIYTDIKKIQGAAPSFSLRERYPESDLILLAVGNLVKVKNYSFLLQAFKTILESFPKAKLIIVGKGKEKSKLKRLSKKLKIDNRVAFEGEIPLSPPLEKRETQILNSPLEKGEIERDLISYYKTADVFVLVSLYEGWGRAVVEAAAAGCPIVMTDVGLAGEVIRDGESGFVAPVNDRTEFVRAVIQLGYNKDLRKRYASAALEALKKLPSKENTLEKIKESWKRALD